MRPENGSPFGGPIGHVALLVARGGGIPAPSAASMPVSRPLTSSACGDNGLAVRYREGEINGNEAHLMEAWSRDRDFCISLY